MDRNKARELHRKIKEALEAIDPTLTVEVGSARFDTTMLRCRVEFHEAGARASVDDREREDFKTCAFQFGLSPNLLDKQFTSRGRRYTIVGLKPRSTQYPVICERDDGKRFKFGTEVAALVSISAVKAKA